MKYHIVIVDDELDLIKNLKYELEDFSKDLQVTYFTSGYEALNLVRQEHVDLVLSDIAMPDMDGFELYSRVKEQDETIPVVLMTGFGYDPNHVVVRTKQKGPVDIVPKPFETEKLGSLLLKRLQDHPPKEE
ncbi:MAG TPA: response regulator [Candidatus Cloacimonadota bacterium]|nr:response regulator [Candidatus Cloacimonadota bacterium]HPT70801.1 response regulator [Candidatus Cloacimonadota bacterium]